MDKEIYDQSIRNLTERGIDRNLAHQAAKIVASDIIGQDRTPQEQAIITKVHQQLNAKGCFN